MSSYAGLDEIGLRKLLDTSSDITERRKIRAALRELRTNNNNSVVHPHIRTPISPAKLSHHQSFRAERRRRPDVDALTKTRSQDDDILYRSRRRREMDAGRGQGGEDGDDENEVVVDIEVKIKEIGNDEQKLTKLLSETRDFNDRRKVRSAIREVKRKTRQQDDSDTPTKLTNQSEDGPPAEPAAVSVLQENQTNLALSRSTECQRSSAEGQEVAKATSERGVEQEIVALQKQLESAETYEERRKLRTEIRELRQKKTGFDEDVVQAQLLQEQQPLNQENGMGHHVRSKVNGISDEEEGKQNGGDAFLNQVPPLPVVEDEEDNEEDNPYSVVNRYSEDDEGNDTRTNEMQDREYAEPSFTEDPDRGYAEPQTHDYVDKEEVSNSLVTDTAVELPAMITNGEETMPVKSVDTMANKNQVVNKPGCGDTSSSSAQENRDNDYEIITPRQIQPNYAQIHKDVPLDECENKANISKSATREVPLDSPDLIKTLPDVPLKSRVLHKKEGKMGREKDVVEEKDEVQVVRNLLPSEIKKKQLGPTGIKVNKVTKPNINAPPKPSQNTSQNSMISPNVEVVPRPPGSRRARIIRSYMELERIKREGVNRADGKPVQITAPNMTVLGSGMKTGGGARGSDQMLEEMLNLQIMQAMGVNPHTIATPEVDTSSKSTPPQRPFHLDIPTPIKTTKPVLKQTPKQTPKLPTSRLQTSGPSHGIAKMLNRFGENSASPPKPASQGFLGNGRGLKKAPARNAFNIDVKNGEVDINISENNRQFLMNKLAPHSRGKASSKPKPSNSPSYNNNSSNTNSNNSRGLAAPQSFESSIKPDGAIVLKNHGVREEEEEERSERTSEIRRTDPEEKGAPSVVADDSRKEKEESKEKLVRGETSDSGRDILSSSSSKASSSSPPSSPPPTSSASSASSRDTTRTAEEKIASESEEREGVSNSDNKIEDVSGQSEIVQEVEPSVLHVTSSTSSSSLSSSPPPSPSPSSQPASPLPSKPSVVPEPEGEADSIETHSPEIDSEERDSVVSQGGSCHSDTHSETDRETEKIPKVEEAEAESNSEPVLEVREDVERDADDEASKCESIQIKPSPLVRRGRPEAEASSSSSSSSPSSSSASSSGTSSSGSSSELDEGRGQTKEKRRPKGLKEAMRRRAQLRASQLANDSAKDEVKEEKKELQEVFSQKESSSESEGVKEEAKMEKVEGVPEGDNKNKNNANLTTRTVENLVGVSKLEANASEDSSESSKQEDVSEESSEVAGSGVKEERPVEELDASSSGGRTSSSSSSSSVESEGTKDSHVDKTLSCSQDIDSVSKVKDSPAAISSKITMTLHSPVSSSTTFPISKSTSPSTSTSENISSVIEVTPRMRERVQSASPSLTNSFSDQSQKASSSVGEDKQDVTVLSVNKTDSNEPSAMKPIRSISSPGTSSTTPSIPRNFGHPFRFTKARDDNAILTPKKTTTSVKRSESAVSSLQSKRNKFLGSRPRPDDDTSPTGSAPAPARSFKNVVSGSKFAALREKFSASNGNRNDNADQGKNAGCSPSSPSTPKSLWQQKSPSSSSLYGGSSITEDSSLNSSSEQKKSIYGTPPTSPPTPLPYKTPPESPLDFRNKTSPSAPMASSTPIGTAELKSPTAAELKRQFLFGADDSQQGDVFTEESGSKDENSNLKDISMAPIEQIEDEAALEKMLEEATEFDERKKIRSRLREVRKKKRDEREQKAQEQERAFEEKMHKLEVESAQQRMRAVGLNVQSPGDRTKTVTETKDDGKTKTVVETTMRDSGSSKSVSMTISSKTEDEGFKSQSLQQESKSISVGPGGSSSVTMSKTVSSSSSSSTTTDKPKGRPKTKFDEDMEKKKLEREEKRKQDEAKFKEQQMQRKKEQYELKKKQAEDAKNRKAALFNKFGGPGGGGAGAKPAGGGGTTMKVQNATTIKQKLLEWAQRVTRGYAGVNVTNFSSSWANGLAFCAVIHHYYPDSFDFNTLDPKQRRKNFDLAFNTAEEQADIMPLLDTDDMIMMKNAPDWKCVFTYVQSLYRHLNK